ncbi:MAG: hypothetical protein QM811_32070 [Pirellulales bacterium]
MQATPTILDNGKIQLDLRVEKSAPAELTKADADAEKAGDFRPSGITTMQERGSITLDDGESLVLGGVVTTKENAGKGRYVVVTAKTVKPTKSAQ